jgi:hypothetical protein
MDRGELVVLPLSSEPWGIDAFQVEGALAGARVCAEWDGRWLEVSRVLLQYAQVAIAVDGVYAEAGFSRPDRLVAAHREPERLMLAMIASCDVLDTAEYTVRGRRRAMNG